MQVFRSQFILSIHSSGHYLSLHLYYPFSCFLIFIRSLCLSLYVSVSLSSLSFCTRIDSRVYCTQLYAQSFLFSVYGGFLLTYSWAWTCDPPAFASQIAGLKSVVHHLVSIISFLIGLLSSSISTKAISKVFPHLVITLDIHPSLLTQSNSSLNWSWHIFKDSLPIYAPEMMSCWHFCQTSFHVSALCLSSLQWEDCLLFHPWSS